MTNEVRRQHFLPFAYLKYFRCLEDIDSRKHATILVDSGSGPVREDKVENQCYSINFYRSSNTQESESGFRAFEDDWNETVRFARAGKDESALLFQQLLVYHFRNLSIRLLTKEHDRFTLVSHASVNFIEQKILRLPEGRRFTDDPNHVHNFPCRSRRNAEVPYGGMT